MHRPLAALAGTVLWLLVALLASGGDAFAAAAPSTSMSPEANACAYDIGSSSTTVVRVSCRAGFGGCGRSGALIQDQACVPPSLPQRGHPRSIGGAFKKEREAFWKAEAKNNPEKYSADDLAKMKSGRAPTGRDGHPMELHHVDRTPTGGVQPMSRTDHRLGENYKKNHPSGGN